MLEFGKISLYTSDNFSLSLSLSLSLFCSSAVWGDKMTETENRV